MVFFMLASMFAINPQQAVGDHASGGGALRSIDGDCVTCERRRFLNLGILSKPTASGWGTRVRCVTWRFLCGDVSGHSFREAKTRTRHN